MTSRWCARWWENFTFGILFVGLAAGVVALEWRCHHHSYGTNIEGTFNAAYPRRCPWWLRQVLPERYLRLFDRLEEVALEPPDDGPFDQSQLAELARFPYLSRITIWSYRDGDGTDLAFLQDLKSVRNVTFMQCDMPQDVRTRVAQLLPGKAIDYIECTFWSAIDEDGELRSGTE